MIALPGPIELDGETLLTASVALLLLLAEAKVWLPGAPGASHNRGSGPVTVARWVSPCRPCSTWRVVLLRWTGWPQNQHPHWLACAQVPSPTGLHWEMHRPGARLQSHSREPCPRTPPARSTTSGAEACLPGKTEQPPDHSKAFLLALICLAASSKAHYRAQRQEGASPAQRVAIPQQSRTCASKRE